MGNTIRTLVLSAVVLGLFFAPAARAQEVESLKGMKSVKAVFDIRTNNPARAAHVLDLVHQSFKELAAAGKNPEFKIVFMGPSVKLLSTRREGFSPEDQQPLDGLVGTISTLSKEGIGLEICKVAMNVAKVDPETVLPEIKAVENGWFSLIGYQSQGYALVPNY